MQSNTNRYLSLSIIFVAIIAFVYVTYQAILIVDHTQISTKEGIYTSYVTTTQQIQDKAQLLTKACDSKACEIQSLLDYVTAIPYQTQTFQRKTPQKTIQENFGDCDDKSNLLISMLHALDIPAYFVLVPHHIFVIVPLADRRFSNIKGLWVNSQKYYILESTAKDSRIGFDLHYALNEIDTIIEPFSNQRLEIDSVSWKK